MPFVADTGTTVIRLSFDHAPARDAREVANLTVTAPVPDPQAPGPCRSPAWA